MSTNQNHKPLVNVLLEAVSKRHDFNINLKNSLLPDVGAENLFTLGELLKKDKDSNTQDDDKMLRLIYERFFSDPFLYVNTFVLFPNLRPVNHFAEGEEVYVVIADFSSGKQGDYKELGFIKTVVEHKAADSPFLKLKTFDDLPDGHHLSTGNTNGHTSTNFGRLLKVSEFDALRDRNKTSLEFLDLFRANSVGPFQNLELYDVSKYQKSDTIQNLELGTALIAKCQA